MKDSRVVVKKKRTNLDEEEKKQISGVAAVRL